MAVLQSTNVQGTLCVNGVAVGGGKDFKYCCFTASTTFTPSQDLVDGDGAVSSTLVSGGGGGGLATISVTTGAYSAGCCSYCKCAGEGGGGGMGQFIEKIDSTDACTVTVGAGGTATPDGHISTSTNNLAQASLGIIDTPGGNTTFGNHTEVGGGNGCSCRFFCVLHTTAQARGECCPATRNGSSVHCTRSGGGAEIDNTAFAFNKSGDFAQYDCFHCNRFTSKYQGGSSTACSPSTGLNCIPSWGDNQTTSSRYSFGPEQIRCPYFQVPYPGAQTQCIDMWTQNNGVVLDGGCHVGTNKRSIWENGLCTTSSLLACDSTAQLNCCFDVPALNAINCGGGAGAGCIKVCVCSASGGACYGNAEMPGGTGGNGLVVLKWFE